MHTCAPEEHFQVGFWGGFEGLLQVFEDNWRYWHGYCKFECKQVFEYSQPLDLHTHIEKHKTDAYLNSRKIRAVHKPAVVAKWSNIQRNCSQLLYGMRQTPCSNPARGIFVYVTIAVINSKLATIPAMHKCDGPINKKIKIGLFVT